MYLKKFEYKLAKFLKKIFAHFKNIDINWGYVLFSAICIASIILLGVNIFRIIKKGYERYEIIQSEKKKVEELIAENLKLKEELKYYSSKEFIDLKAREELNLAFPHQKLVYIEREVQIDFDEDQEKLQKPLRPSWKLWYDLIFT